jgi:NADH-quinone oxidoreductase subunit N
MLTQLDLIALLPLLIVSGTAVILMLAIAFFRHHSGNATIAVLGLNAALLSTLMIWVVAPKDVTDLLVVDHFSLIATTVMIIATLACTTFSHIYLQARSVQREEWYLLLLLALAGGIVLVSSRHFASLFIGLEMLSIPLYGLIAYTLQQSRSLEAGIKYLVLSASASAMLLFGMALLYADTGSLSFTGITQNMAAAATPTMLMVTGTVLILAALAFKLSLAPFHLWTPDVYEGAPAPIGAFLATTAKIAVAYALMRLFAYLPVFSEQESFRNASLILAAMSITIGNVLAMNQQNVKRLLAYSSIAHFGYLLVIMAALNFATIEAFHVYLITYTLATLAAFGVLTIASVSYLAQRPDGADADSLHHLRGLFWKQPYLAAVMTVAMLSLAGIPMTAGFIGKFYMMLTAVNAAFWWLLGFVVVGSAIGLYYYMRVVITLFLVEPGMTRQQIPFNWSHTAGGIVLALIAVAIIVLGVYPEPLLELATFGELQ